MVKTLAFTIIDFALAGTGNLAVLTPEGPMIFTSGGRLAAVNDRGFALGSFLSDCANRDFEQRSRADAAAPRCQWRGFGRGKCG